MTECTPPRGPTAFDRAAGRAVAARREAMGLSQVELAAACGVTAQQMRKYETGTNRMSVSRLHAIAGALDVSIASLLDEPAAAGASAPTAGNAKAAELMLVATALDDGVLDHLLGIARALGALPDGAASA